MYVLIDHCMQYYYLSLERLSLLLLEYIISVRRLQCGYAAEWRGRGKRSVEQTTSLALWRASADPREVGLRTLRRALEFRGLADNLTLLYFQQG